MLLAHGLARAKARVGKADDGRRLGLFRGSAKLWGRTAPFMELVNASVTGSCAEMVCFKLNEPDGLRTVRKLGAAPEVVAALPLDSFISYHRLSGGTLAGKLF